MTWVIVGLGNPGEDYVGTRHNAGREMLLEIDKREGTKGKLFGKKAIILTPDSYMNNSGGPIKKLVTSKKAAENLVVLQDELDLPLGAVKISFGSGSGGHKGIESIIRALKTPDFIRIRIGISPATPSGKLRKPDSEKIVDFVLGKFKPAELMKLKAAKKTVAEALEFIMTEGLSFAMTQVNAR